MAKTTSFLLLAFGLLILSAFVTYAEISVPDVPEPVCAGGWDVRGVYYPKELGGCCRGAGCCEFEAFKDSPACIYSCTTVDCCVGMQCCQFPKYKDHPMCSCKGIECCQYKEYANSLQCTCTGLECCKVPEFSDSPVCTCKGQDCCIYQEYASDPNCECVGLECCELDEFKINPMCSCTGTECCKYEEYEGEPECKCTGEECCELEEFKDTPLCVLTQTPVEEECNAADVPDCPLGGAFHGDIPMLRNPSILGGGLCRGACGPDCPKTCNNVPSGVTKCIPDTKGKCFYTCTYENVISCGVNDACVVHDQCYDKCAAKGETEMCIDIPGPWWNPFNWIYLRFDFCHCACDYGCASKYGFDCLNFMNGEGPFDYRQLYSDMPKISGPFKSC